MDNARPIKVATADFGDLTALQRAFGRESAGVLFEMQQRQPAAQAFAPAHWITAALLHPIDIGLARQVGGIGQIVEPIKDGLTGHAGELVIVIMIAQGLSRSAQHGSSVVKAFRQNLHLLQSGDGEVGIGISGGSAAKDAQPVHHLFGCVANAGAAFMGGADHHPRVIADATNLDGGDRPDAADLHRAIADGPDPAQGGRQAGGVLTGIADGIELGGDLGGAHADTFSVSVRRQSLRRWRHRRRLSW